MNICLQGTKIILLFSIILFVCNFCVLWWFAMDTRQLSKEFILEFLEIYRSQTCLWKIKSKDYSNREMKQKAYALLIEKLHEIDKNANKEKVIKKIDSFRGSFRKEVKKVEASKKSGVREEDIYKPKLWYFKYLTFLLDQESPRRSVSNTSTVTESILSDELTEDSANSNDVESESFITSPQTPATVRSRSETPISNTSNRSRSRTHKRKRRGDDVTTDIFTNVGGKLDEPQNEFSVIGINISNKLRKLPAETCIVVEKLFMDILFEAQLGNISRHTRMNLVDSQQFSSSFHQPTTPPEEMMQDYKDIFVTERVRLCSDTSSINTA